MWVMQWTEKVDWEDESERVSCQKIEQVEKESEMVKCKKTHIAVEVVVDVPPLTTPPPLYHPPFSSYSSSLYRKEGISMCFVMCISEGSLILGKWLFPVVHYLAVWSQEYTIHPCDVCVCVLSPVPLAMCVSFLPPLPSLTTLSDCHHTSSSWGQALRRNQTRCAYLPASLLASELHR